MHLSLSPPPHQHTDTDTYPPPPYYPFGSSFCFLLLLGFLSKHASAIYSATPYDVTHPTATGWTRPDPASYQKELDAAPTISVSEEPNGTGVVECYTVVHKRDGAAKGIVIGKMEDGQRFVAATKDRETMTLMMAREFTGTTVKVSTSKETQKCRFETVPKSSL